ncbi:hypothetical protein J6590_055519 [Homalodisca vitripennis]|nr:hypothetical protein J6590_055519 [Homalodisca vitripennis]
MPRNGDIAAYADGTLWLPIIYGKAAMNVNVTPLSVLADTRTETPQSTLLRARNLESSGSTGFISSDGAILFVTLLLHSVQCHLPVFLLPPSMSPSRRFSLRTFCGNNSNQKKREKEGSEIIVIIKRSSGRPWKQSRVVHQYVNQTGRTVGRPCPGLARSHKRTIFGHTALPQPRVTIAVLCNSTFFISVRT